MLLSEQIEDSVEGRGGLWLKLQKLLRGCCEETVAGLFEASSAELGCLRLALQTLSLRTEDEEGALEGQPMEVDGEGSCAAEDILEAQTPRQLLSGGGVEASTAAGVVFCVASKVRQAVRKTVAAELSLAPLECGGQKEGKRKRSLKAAAVAAGSAGWTVRLASLFPVCFCVCLSLSVTANVRVLLRADPLLCVGRGVVSQALSRKFELRLRQVTEPTYSAFLQVLAKLSCPGVLAEEGSSTLSSQTWTLQAELTLLSASQLPQTFLTRLVPPALQTLRQVAAAPSETKEKTLLSRAQLEMLRGACRVIVAFCLRVERGLLQEFNALLKALLAALRRLVEWLGKSPCADAAPAGAASAATEAALAALLALLRGHGSLLLAAGEQAVREGVFEEVLLEPSLCALVERLQRPPELRGKCLGDASDLRETLEAAVKQQLLQCLDTLPPDQVQQLRLSALRGRAPADAIHALSLSLVFNNRISALLQLVLPQVKAVGSRLNEALRVHREETGEDAAAASFQLSRLFELIAMTVSAQPVQSAQKRQSALHQLALLPAQALLAAAAAFEEAPLFKSQGLAAAEVFFGGPLYSRHFDAVWRPQRAQDKKGGILESGSENDARPRSFVWRVEAAAVELLCGWALKHDIQELRQFLSAALLQVTRCSKPLLLHREEGPSNAVAGQSLVEQGPTMQEACGARLYALSLLRLLREFGCAGASEALLSDSVKDLASTIEAAEALRCVAVGSDTTGNSRLSEKRPRRSSVGEEARCRRWAFPGWQGRASTHRRSKPGSLVLWCVMLVRVLHREKRNQPFFGSK